MTALIDDNELDRQLREAVPYIDDRGFTARVLQRLPVQSAPMRLRATILIVATIVASALAYVVSGRARFLSDFVVELFKVPMPWLLGLTFAVGIVVGAIGL